MKVRIERIDGIYFVDYQEKAGWKNYSSHRTHEAALADKAHLCGVSSEIKRSMDALFDGSDAHMMKE